MPLLFDTSAWIDYFAGDQERIRQCLLQGQVVMHPWIIGEIALGNLGKRRETILELLAQLETVVVAEDPEVMRLIATHDLGGSGIGWVDAHLLAACLLTPGVQLLTRDRRLQALRVRHSLKGVIGVWDDS